MSYFLGMTAELNTMSGPGCPTYRGGGRSWSLAVLRRATDEDVAAVEKAADRFVRRRGYVVDTTEDGPVYAGGFLDQVLEAEGERARKAWLRTFRRATNTARATRIRDGMIVCPA